MDIALHVNIDHVATLRQARGTNYPDPVEAALVAERAGAHGITAHLREDRRHVNDRDIRVLREVVRGTFNLEMAATEEMLAIALATKPDRVTLVPERREERTTEGGLDVVTHEAHLARIVGALSERGIRVSLFIAPSPAQIDASLAVGAVQVELHTGEYAHARPHERSAFAQSLADGARHAAHKGLRVAAGHGLTLENVGPIAAIPECVELNIGHAIVSDAVISGFDRAVRAMLEAMRRARGAR
ncbi:MAG: pyridoxine 5'-phosphate synthase [Myxococcales bacterium]|nr:pyridoxine 5'-phosphate synthase [Myxococcales bacterium]